ncbi:hypothetical protein B0H17DRAFT_1215680 [Mycena rosella]|uniref:Uncharacterized protein n=1 Tax=Mycena rosella TaxID=1033263 RepID=A0AAD7FXG0_MYCRO|nr:hypothetical protein B0H17DRAFT_1215680 [Mycena rosella]
MTDAEPTLPARDIRTFCSPISHKHPQLSAGLSSRSYLVRLIHSSWPVDLLSGWDRLEPFLYRVLNLDNSELVNAIESRFEYEANELAALELLTPTQGEQTAFLKTTTRHILCTTPDIFFNANTQWQTITCLLRLNPTLFELSVKKYSTPEPTPSSGNRKQLPKEMCPTRLTLQFDRDKYGTVDLAEPLFSAVTQLTLLNTAVLERAPESWAHWMLALPALPALTRLCVTFNIARAIIPHVLTACPRLQAIVAFWWMGPIPRYQREKALESPEWAAKAALYTASRKKVNMVPFEQRMCSTPDVRVVLVGVPDFFDAWERGVRSRNDMWTHVEDFIARKQRGEIDPTTYILDKGDPWV